MDERKTHYQVSFTARQALVLFVGLLLALGLAYFLGIMTGLVGREGPAAVSVATTPAVSPTREAPSAALEGPAASAPPKPRPPEIASARTPSAAPGGRREIQLFEDRGGPEPTVAPASRATAVPATSGAAEAIWVHLGARGQGAREQAVIAWLPRGGRDRVEPERHALPGSRGALSFA